MAKSSFSSNYEKDTWIHRLDPRVKLFFILSFVFVPLFFTKFLFLAAIVVIILPFWLSARIDVAPISGLIVAIFIFSFVAVIFATFYNYNHPDQVVLFSIGPISATNIGLKSGLVLGLRAAIPAFVVLILICTTDPAELCKAMMKLKMPLTVAFMMLGALRMFPLVTEEMSNIATAQTIRGLKKKGIKNNFKAFQLAALPLLINSLRRSRTMGLAIESKGFGCRQWNEYYQDFSFNKIDYAVTVFTVLLVVAAIVIRYYYGFGVDPFVSQA
jgi:energy-coupling factor transport system permease protein